MNFFSVGFKTKPVQIFGGSPIGKRVYAVSLVKPSSGVDSEPGSVSIFQDVVNYPIMGIKNGFKVRFHNF